ncbi:MAG: Pyridoxal-5-phosphate-dependent protein beta subunit [Rhodospirillales bacterium]|nr:Pyridoxal-5-phosphate-dependent protein beta subunit [Rhodospirillales bacterium]
MATTTELPTCDDVAQAAERLDGVAVRTPLLRSDLLDELTGGRILLKPEGLQRTGSFKIRGAYNRLKQLVETGQDRGGVVAFSSGNHAQGVASAARLLDMKAAIVMPSDAPALKIANTRRLGGEIILYDRWIEDREAICARVAAERGAIVVPSFDDAGVIAGQGTVGLEIAADAKALGLTLDAVYVPASGGGLAAGIGLALDPATELYTAEPAGLDDHARSLAAGERTANDPAARSICDALLAAMPGRMTFALNRTRLAGGVTATDGQVLRAMAFGYEALKLVIEPGGAVALAALLSGGISAKDRTVAIVLSGGNVAPELFARCLTQGS